MKGKGEHFQTVWGRRTGGRKIFKHPYKKPKLVLVTSFPINYSVSGGSFYFS